MNDHTTDNRKAKTSISIRRRVLEGARELGRRTDRSTSWIIDNLVERGLEAEHAAADPTVSH